MRKVLFLVAVTAMLASCSKESCWECDVTTTGGLNYREQFCDRSKKEIQEMQDKPLVTKDNTGEIIFSTSFSNCTRK